jgi:hypothetical protein
MSDTDGRPVGRPPYRTHSKNVDAQPGDEQPAYTHTQLIRFDTRFRRRLLHAFKRGLEHKESAAADVCTTTSTSVLIARRRTVEFEDRARSENPDLSGRTNAIW